MCGFSANVEAGRAPRRRSVVRDAGTTRRDERTNVLASIWYSTGHIVVMQTSWSLEVKLRTATTAKARIENHEKTG